MSMKSRPGYVVYIDFNVELVNLFRCDKERSNVLPGLCARDLERGDWTGLPV